MLVKIVNSYKDAIKTGKWANPGAKLYRAILSSVYAGGTSYEDALHEAYLIVGKVHNDPHSGVTPYTRSGCKYPHHIIRNGKMVLSIPGVKAAYARAKQMGVYKGEVKAHLDRHLKELGLMTKDGIYYKERMEENFLFIESMIDKHLGTHLIDEEERLNEIDMSIIESIKDFYYFEEKSHGRLKFDFRLGWDAETGHKIKVVYSLDNINITDVGNFYYDYDGKKTGATHDSHLDYTRKNITKKGNTDHQSYGQKVLAIIDMTNKKKLNEVNLLNPFCQWINPRDIIQSPENLINANKYADKHSDSRIHLVVGQIDNTKSFKTTHWIGNQIDKDGQDYQWAHISNTEELRDARGWKAKNMFGRRFHVYGHDDSGHIIYKNPNKKQALNELYMRMIDCRNYAKNLLSHPNFQTDPRIQQQYDREKRNFEIIKHDYDTINSGSYDISIMKKYRESSIGEAAGLRGLQLINAYAYEDYRPPANSMETTMLGKNDNIEEELAWVEYIAQNGWNDIDYLFEKSHGLKKGEIDNTDTYKTTKITNVTKGMFGLKENMSMDEDLFEWALSAFVEDAEDDNPEEKDEEKNKEKKDDDNGDNTVDPGTDTGGVTTDDSGDNKDDISADSSGPSDTDSSSNDNSTAGGEEGETKEPEKEEVKPEPAKKLTPISRPQQFARQEEDKNGVRRKNLYVEFIRWAKTFNSKNIFGSNFDKDIFHVTYPFVPHELRYFYRLADPTICVLSGNLTFFPVIQLRKLNSDNQQMKDYFIFAATDHDLRVFSTADKAVYLAKDDNGKIVPTTKLGDTFDIYIQNMIKQGDILNGPREDTTLEYVEELT